MGVMPERIGKGPILRKLDARYADKTKRQRALDRLTANPTMDVAELGAVADTGGDIVFPDPVNDKDHVKDHWFNRNNKGWWPAKKDVDKILHYGLRTALKEAQDLSTGTNDVPVKTLWICSGPKGVGCFEVYVYSTPVQVTMIIFSPEIPDYTDKPGLKEEPNIWVVKRIDTALPEGALDGPKTGDDCEDPLKPVLPSGIKIVKRRPRTLPDLIPPSP